MSNTTEKYPNISYYLEQHQLDGFTQTTDDLAVPLNENEVDAVLRLAIWVINTENVGENEVYQELVETIHQPIIDKLEDRSWAKNWPPANQQSQT